MTPLEGENRKANQKKGDFRAHLPRLPRFSLERPLRFIRRGEEGGETLRKEKTEPEGGGECTQNEKRTGWAGNKTILKSRARFGKGNSTRGIVLEKEGTMFHRFRPGCLISGRKGKNTSGQGESGRSPKLEGGPGRKRSGGGTFVPLSSGRKKNDRRWRKKHSSKGKGALRGEDIPVPCRRCVAILESDYRKPRRTTAPNQHATSSLSASQPVEDQL